jgi:hypothetical protein
MVSLALSFRIADTIVCVAELQLVVDISDEGPVPTTYSFAIRKLWEEHVEEDG